jgi:hypothetical protein
MPYTSPAYAKLHSTFNKWQTDSGAAAAAFVHCICGAPAQLQLPPGCRTTAQGASAASGMALRKQRQAGRPSKRQRQHMSGWFGNAWSTKIILHG